MENSFRRKGNPVLARMDRFEDFAAGERASFKGIAPAKSFYFLALILLGLAAFIYMHSYFGNQGYDAVEITESYTIYANEMMIFLGATIATFIAGLIAAFIPRTTPVTGSVYYAGMGYAVTFISLLPMLAEVRKVVVEAFTSYNSACNHGCTFVISQAL